MDLVLFPNLVELEQHRMTFAFPDTMFFRSATLTWTPQQPFPARCDCMPEERPAAVEVCGAFLKRNSEAECFQFQRRLGVDHGHVCCGRLALLY